MKTNLKFLNTVLRQFRMLKCAHFLLALPAILFACGEPVGTECEISGSGFHAKDPCRHKCLSRWQLTCPDDQDITPNTCSGSFSCQPGSCPDGQVCYHDDDPFDDRSFCVAVSTCGDLSPEQQSAWELKTLARQEEVRKEREAKAARKAAWQAEHGKNPTTPVVNNPNPASEAASPVAKPQLKPSLPCVSTPDRVAVSIDSDNKKSEHRHQEVLSEPIILQAGDSFERILPYGWRFALEPHKYGWRMYLWDRQEQSGAIDLSAVTPPFRGVPHARDLFGWHFRNLDNTGPNTGEVNAPQHLRLFEFDPNMTGTAGFRPPQGGETLSPSPGRGWLSIEDLKLSPVAAGEKASIEQISFRACFTLPRPTLSQEQQWQSALAASRESQQASQLKYDEIDLELMGHCGLPSDRYKLSARVLPRTVTLDIDGDDAGDHLVQVQRIADGTHGLALCRAGTWVEWIGPGHPAVTDQDTAHTLTAMEAWEVVEKDHGSFGYLGEPDWPLMDGQALVVERQEKSMLLLFWHKGSLRIQTVYRFVEP